MKLKYLTTILFFCVSFSHLYAQWDPQISQYWRVKTYFNPAFAGETDELQGVVLHRQQWIGITNAPKTFIVNADMPIKFFDRVHGVGVSVMSESIGLFSNYQMGGQYVYKKKWGKNTLNVGIQLGMTNISFDASKIHLVSEDGTDDAMPTTGIQSSNFDGNLGVSWVNPRYYIGISSTHLLEPTFKLSEEQSSYITRTYYLTGGCNIPFENSLYELQPSFLVKSDAVLTQYDVTARVVYNQMFNGGISWRKDDGFVFLVGIRIKGIDAGYAYDLSTSAISKVSSGSHELFVRYSMPIKLDKGERKSHKNVRIL